MTDREKWLHLYRTDPAFRLERLYILSKRNYRKQGGFSSPYAYKYETDKARAELKELTNDR